MLKKIEALFKKAGYKPLIALLIAELLIHIYVFASFGVRLWPDSERYMTPATWLWQNGTFSGCASFPFNTPGYPLLLGGTYFITGGSNILAVILQIIMSLAVCYFIYKAVLDMTGSRLLSFLGGLFYILDFPMYDMSVSILQDTFYMFAVGSAVFLIIEYFLEKKTWMCVLSFAIWHFAVWIRPTCMYINIVIMALLLVLAVIRKIPARIPILFGVFYLVFFGGWCLRNRIETGELRFTTYADEVSFDFHAPLVMVEKDKIEGDGTLTKLEAIEIFRNDLYKDYPDFDSLSRDERIQIKNEIGNAYIKDNLWITIRMHIRVIFECMVAPGTFSIGELPLPRVIQMCIMLLVAGTRALAIGAWALAFIISIKKLNWIDWMLFILSAYMMAPLYGTESRYRLSYLPMAMIGMGLCLYHLTGGKKVDDK